MENCMTQNQCTNPRCDGKLRNKNRKMKKIRENERNKKLIHKMRNFKIVQQREREREPSYELNVYVFLQIAKWLCIFYTQVYFLFTSQKNHYKFKIQIDRKRDKVRRGEAKSQTHAHKLASYHLTVTSQIIKSKSFIFRWAIHIFGNILFKRPFAKTHTHNGFYQSTTIRQVA